MVTKAYDILQCSKIKYCHLEYYKRKEKALCLYFSGHFLLSINANSTASVVVAITKTCVK